MFNGVENACNSLIFQREFIRRNCVEANNFSVSKDAINI